MPATQSELLLGPSATGRCTPPRPWKLHPCPAPQPPSSPGSTAMQCSHCGAGRHQRGPETSQQTQHRQQSHTETQKRECHTCTPFSHFSCSLTQRRRLPRVCWQQDRASSHLNGARILQRGFPRDTVQGSLSHLSTSSSMEGAMCSKEPSPRSSTGQGSVSPRCQHTPTGTQQLLEPPHLLLLHNPATRMRLQNRHRITWKSWKLTLFYVLEKHWVFHTIFKHKMFIFPFNLYNFSGLLVPLTLSVYKGWTIQAIAT